MARHQMPFELVFKRGGEDPGEIRSWHLSVDEAITAAEQRAERQKAQGFTDVWLAYDLWDHTGGQRGKRIRHNVRLQEPKKRR